MALQTNHASDYANVLLASLGEVVRIDEAADHPAYAWRRSGLLDVMGAMLPLPLASHADGALMALKALGAPSDLLPQTGSELLGERARLISLKTQGNQTAGGYGRLLDAKNGRLALNLVREDDWALIPAWLEADVASWDDISNALKDRSVQAMVSRGAEMGLAVSIDRVIPHPKTWFSKKQICQSRRSDKPLIVDMSALWAGPLASNLLALTGAKVIKIESPNRPDGMRRGHAGFYDLINSGKDCVAVDFKNAQDLARLKRLLGKADVVIEASRPRAMQQLGIVAEEFATRNAGQIWVRLTAYGVDKNRIGFGDDIGVSAGLSTILHRATGRVGFVGDAIADPITGLHLALLIKASLKQGGGSVIDVSMEDIVRLAMGDIESDIGDSWRRWGEIAEQDNAPYYPIRKPFAPVKALGVDNSSWLN